MGALFVFSGLPTHRGIAGGGRAPALAPDAEAQADAHGQVASPEEVADLVAFPCGDGSSYIDDTAFPLTGRD